MKEQMKAKSQSRKAEKSFLDSKKFGESEGNQKVQQKWHYHCGKNIQIMKV